MHRRGSRDAHLASKTDAVRAPGPKADARFLCPECLADGTVRTVAEVRGRAEENPGAQKLNQDEATKIFYEVFPECPPADFCFGKFLTKIDCFATREELQAFLITTREAAVLIRGKPSTDFLACIEIFEDVTPHEAAEQTFELVKEWKEKILDKGYAEPLQNRRVAFYDFFGSINPTIYSPKPKAMTSQQIKEWFAIWLRIHEFAYALPPDWSVRTTRYYSPAKEIYHSLANVLKRALFAGPEHAFSEHSTAVAAVNEFLDLAKTAAAYPNKHVVGIFVERIWRYTSLHGLDKEAKAALIENLLPAISQEDPRVAILLRDSNVWSMDHKSFGVADFICHCYAKTATPLNINELMHASRQIPTSELSKLEQNRLDGLSLRGVFGGLRDFIHDQVPGVHDVLSAMIEYYETHDGGKIRELITQIEKEHGRYLSCALLLDLEQYERDVKTTVAGVEQTERVIDVLRRLRQNTDKIETIPPESSDIKLNESIRDIAACQFRSRKRTILVETLDYVNEKLTVDMREGKRGIEPNVVIALSWLEHQAFEALRDLKFEGQFTAHQERWFHTILKFHDLTFSPREYNEAEFEAFIGKLKDSGSFEAASRIIGNRVITQISELAKVYGEKRKTSLIGMLWSGNINRELLGFFIPKPAETVVGERLRKEFAIHPYDRISGD
jgi:hypothetical protein